MPNIEDIEEDIEENDKPILNGSEKLKLKKVVENECGRNCLKNWLNCLTVDNRKRGLTV